MDSIGSTIKQAREEKGVSIEEVHQATRIHPKILKAIEENRFQDIPSALYVKGFIRKYADFLGLATDKILDEFSRIYNDSSRPEYLLKNEKEAIGLEKRHFSTLLLYLAGIVLVIAAAYVLPHKVLRHKETPAKSEAILPLAEETQKTTAQEVSGSFDLMIRCREDVWIQAKCDGKILFQNVLKKGAFKKLTANQKINLWVGNASALVLEMNGKPLIVPVRGVVKNIVITRQGLSVGKK